MAAAWLRPGVGLLSTSWTSLDPADPGLGVPGSGIPEGPMVAGLSFPRTATFPLSRWVCSGGASSSRGQGLVPPLPGPSCVDLEAMPRAASFLWTEGPEWVWGTPVSFHGVRAVQRRRTGWGGGLWPWPGPGDPQPCRRTVTRSQPLCTRALLKAASTLSCWPGAQGCAVGVITGSPAFPRALLTT